MVQGLGVRVYDAGLPCPRSTLATAPGRGLRVETFVIRVCVLCCVSWCGVRVWGVGCKVWDVGCRV